MLRKEPRRRLPRKRQSKGTADESVSLLSDITLICGKGLKTECILEIEMGGLYLWWRKMQTNAMYCIRIQGLYPTNNIKLVSLPWVLRKVGMKKNNTIVTK